MSTIKEVVAKYENLIGERVAEEMAAELLAREDELMDQLRMVGVQQFGVYPEFIAEVLAALGLGTPLSTEARTMVHNNFHARLEQLRRDSGQ